MNTINQPNLRPISLRSFGHHVCFAYVATALVIWAPNLSAQTASGTPSKGPVVSAQYRGIRTLPRFISSPNPPKGETVVPFHPTMNAQEYAAAKAKADGAAVIGARPYSPAASGPAPAGPITSFSGIDKFGAIDYGTVWTPPDTHGAVGRGQFVEVVNNRYAVYALNGTLLMSVPMSSFFNSTSKTTDARVVYDRTYDRFIVINIVNPGEPGPQYLFFAISSTGDATGSYIHYAAFFPLSNGAFIDYPQLGMDQGALFFTVNVLAANGTFQYAQIAVLSKYNAYFTGRVGIYTFTGLSGTLSPSMVLDSNPVSVFLAAMPPPSSFVRLYKEVLAKLGDSGCSRR